MPYKIDPNSGKPHLIVLEGLSVSIVMGEPLPGPGQHWPEINLARNQALATKTPEEILKEIRNSPHDPT